MTSTPDTIGFQVTPAKLAFMVSLWFVFTQARDVFMAVVERDQRLKTVENTVQAVPPMALSLQELRTGVETLKSDLKGVRDLTYTQQQNQAQQIQDLQAAVKRLESRAP